MKGQQAVQKGQQARCKVNKDNKKGQQAQCKGQTVFRNQSTNVLFFSHDPSIFFLLFFKKAKLNKNKIIVRFLLHPLLYYVIE